MKTRYVIGYLGVAAIAVACGSSSSNTSGSTGPATCESAYAALCQKGCDCGQGSCRFVSKGDAGASASFSWKTFDECKNFFVVLGCNGAGAKSINYDACTSAVTSAACVPGIDGQGVAYPAACDAKGDGGS